MLNRDLRIVGGAGDEAGGDRLEVLVEGLVIEEDPIIMVLVIESILDLADRARYLPQVRVSRQRNEGGVHSWAICSGGREAHWGIQCRPRNVFRVRTIRALPNTGEADALRKFIEVL